MARVSKADLIRLQKTLKTDGAIGAKYGISRQAVHQLRQKYGLDYNRKKHVERNTRILAQFKKAVTGSKIAANTGLSVSQVYRILAQLKKKKR